MSDADYGLDNEQKDAGDQLDPEFLRLQKWFKAGRQHLKEWYTEAEHAYANVAGDQWTAEEKAELKDQLRPALVFNRIAPIIDSVAGYEIQNRQEVRYLPRQMGQVQVNEVLTAAAKWFRDLSDAEDEESDAFLDSVICGLGWVETVPEYDDDPDGKPVDRRIDPLEMCYDPASKKKNLEDRRFTFRAKKYPIEDAQEMFPDVPDEDLDATWADASIPETDPHQQQEARFYKNDQSGDDANNPRKEVMIVQAQWWDKESYYRVLDPQSRKIVEFSSKKFNLLKKQAKQFGVSMPPHVKAQRKVFKQAFLGKRILESSDCPYGKGFTLNPITGKRDRNKNVFYGLVRAMLDPQAWANKFFSSLIHQFATSGKGLLAETDAVKSVRQFEDDYADGNTVKWLEPGSISKNKILQLQGANINQGIQGLMEYAIGSLRDVTGVNIEMLGQAEKDQPGILEYQRKQAGLTILAGFFDSLRRFRKTQGHILLYYIQHLFSDGRLIKIDGEDGQKYIPLLRNPDIDTYDVIVDDAPTSPNQKEHTWLLITQLMPILRGMTDPMVLIEFLKFSPLPSSLVQKLTELAQKKAAQPPQPSPADQAKIAQSQSAVARNIAGAIKDLSQAGVQGPGPEEDIRKQAVEALLSSGQSSQDHAEAMQQQGAQQAHEAAMAQMQHQQQMQQNAQQAALQPAPAQGG